MFEKFITETQTSGAPTGPSSEPQDELALYLSTDVVRLDDSNKPVDPFRWWRDHRDSYPNLSSMAMDYLCIPGKLWIYFRDTSISESYNIAQVQRLMLNVYFLVAGLFYHISGTV